MRRTESAGVIASALFLLHLVVLVVAPLADAHAPIDPHAVPHVSTPGGDDCPPSHDDLGCQFCRTLQGVPDPLSTAIRFAGASVVRTALLAATTRDAHTTGTFSPVGSRAPPLA